MTSERDEGLRLPAAHESLARGTPAAEPGTIHVLSLTGGISLRAREGREITFGRNRPEVHVCLGEDDLSISRSHGSVRRLDGTWWLQVRGRAPLRLPDGTLLFPGDDLFALPEGYTPVFVRGARAREHLLEIHVAGADPRPPSRHLDATIGPRRWPLDADERLALIALGHRYLLHEERAAPLTWRQAAALLDEARPGMGWTPKRVEHVVVAVRSRLCAAGVAGLTREEVGEPVGNTLNDNLLRELLLSTTLVPRDLSLLEQP
ncbi:MAG: FHA domain-containing protein [Sporichthyaceae bacterium]